MKKVSLILLITIYSVATVGVCLKKFYCCGNLKSVSVVITDTEKEKCGMGDEKSGCCESRFQWLKVKDDHLAPSDIDLSFKHFTDLHIFTPLWQTAKYELNEEVIINGSHAPPLDAGIPIYISNRVFRI
jgi:hypothetical protein